ncbi:nucleotidyl transferase AbiEii/AbiGii toxin family protein [Dickeya fangzhongdai]|uniref:nucleotidyl transferase AbiEii/AbiGii toxin family protein n=1 Tax=Dickeya fangzhongdai TaxID=1778540 RepID=UPI001EFBCF0A|nr:nucleotidyl transferase AbiEii/AbiGii toxin family protein [Dickeya fangzhongdai]ULR32450.1 nucleotidyl transferase AbiEii/AbiGii toxin family protein [Dickeya fangzhongdai]
MSEYKLTHHKIIRSVLENFNTDFFIDNSIFFGGGTRIALEINEYRESIDVDFLCPNKTAYRAVREQVTSASLGKLVKKEFIYAREIGFDRYAVRTFIREQDTNIKLEIVSCDNYELVGDSRSIFPVPFIDRETCFYTKLLANSDRCLQGQCKDIFDILAMYDAWGKIPEEAFRKAEEHYGSSILNDLIRSLNDICSNHEKYYELADGMLIQRDFSSKLIKTTTQELLSQLSQ